MEDLVHQLFELLVQRQIEQGKILILNNRKAFASVPPGDALSPFLFYVLSGWAEYSAVAAEAVKALAAAYSSSNLPLSQQSCWIEGGMVNFAQFEHRDGDVEKHFKWLHETAQLFQVAPDVLGTAWLAKSRTEKKNVQYSPGMEGIRAAKGLYQQAGLPAMVAVAKVTEAWLLMQIGDRSEATRNWSEAFEFLKGSEDFTTLGNIKFGQSRLLDHDGHAPEAAKAMVEAIQLYSKCRPPHRTLSRALIEAANQCFRMMPEEFNCLNARKLYDSGTSYIARARELLEQTPSDFRNGGRMLLCLVNQQMCAPHFLAAKLRLAAQNAYDFGEQHKDKLIMARARLKQAVVESRAACVSEDPESARLKALEYSRNAGELANELQNARLRARIHTLRGNLFLEKKSLLYDPDKAVLECDYAVRAMANHLDDDYVVAEIRRLNHRIDSASKEYKVILLITEWTALGQPLDTTIKDAEHAIIQALAESLGRAGNPHRIAVLLDISDHKVAEHLDKIRQHYVVSPPQVGDHVLFQVSESALNQPLAKTRRAMEHAIVRAACIRYGCSIHHVANALNTGHKRIAVYFPEIEAELRHAGCS